MDTLKEAKEWLFHKFQGLNTSDTIVSAPFRGATALTPKNIPEFVIPGSEPSSRRTSSETFSELDFGTKRNSYGGRSFTSSPPESPTCLSPSESAPCIRAMKDGKVKSAPVTPRVEVKHITSCRDAHSSQGFENNKMNVTNEDPLSFAAISLPHFRVKTSYGFTTLTENPHTRRKESLFHVGNEGLLPKRGSKAYRQNSLGKLSVLDRSSPELNRLSRSGSCVSNGSASRSMPSVVVTAARQDSPSRSPSPDIENIGDLSNRRLSPTYNLYNDTRNGKMNTNLLSRQNRYYNRRRSSLGIPDSSECNLSSASSDMSSLNSDSREHVNDGQRRSLGDLKLPTPPSPTFKRHSAPNIRAGSKKSLAEVTKPRSSSFNAFVPSNQLYNPNHSFAPFGELKFSFMYLPASKQFKVTLIKAENLGGHQKQDKVMNTYAKVCLMPGKVQKQSSAVIKKTRDPVFEQDIYFHDISLKELHAMTLLIKMFAKNMNFKPQEFIGEVSIPLENYDVMVENRIWKDLESHKEKEDLGFLSVGLKFDPGHGLLTVLVDQARQLPLHPLTGSPDPYVKVEVSQRDKPVSKHQTITHKKESNPAFEQTFTFDICPLINEMHATTVNIQVYDHDRFRSDVLIGQVVLGSLATEVGQYGHWQEILEKPGSLISKWHYLIDLDD
ncbi:hypothetical protein ACF0H5_013509 [Mactra antiquata]